jgi:hypothetical protein
MPCGKCGTRLAVSPSSQAMLKAGRAVGVICEECLEGCAQEDDIDFADLTEEQVREVEENKKNWDMRN